MGLGIDGKVKYGSDRGSRCSGGGASVSRRGHGQLASTLAQLAIMVAMMVTVDDISTYPNIVATMVNDDGGDGFSDAHNGWE